MPTIEVVILRKCQKEGGAWLDEGRHTCRRNHSVEPLSRQHGRLSGAQIVNPQKPISHGQIGVKIFDLHCHFATSPQQRRFLSPENAKTTSVISLRLSLLKP